MFDWSNKIILIAEDEEINYVYLEEIIFPTNAFIIRAHNGNEAIRFIEENPKIDLVLLDIKMPFTDGYIAAARIKEIRPKIPIIAQTAYAMPGEREAILSAGCDDYMAKPINHNDLLTKIDIWLSIESK